MKNERSNSFLSSLKTRLWLVRDQDSISYKMISGFTNACNYLPKPIRRKILSFFDNYAIISSRFFSIFGQITIPAYLVKGKEKSSKTDLKILLLGDEKLFPYLSNKLFFEDPKIEKKFNIKLWNLKKDILQQSKDIDAVLIKSDRFYSSYF
jgi:hypothetical protein